MKKKILFAILVVSRAMGLFWLARKLTSRDLRILCYHGASLKDENEFRGGLFVTPGLFESRLAHLKKHGYNVLPLGEAVRALYGESSLPPSPTVITIDDGWLGTSSVMADFLQSYGYPSTLYLSTYYVAKQFQVFNVAVDYVLWKASPQTIDLTDLAGGLEGVFDTGHPEQRRTATTILSAYGNSLSSADERQGLLQRLCKLVGVSYQSIRADRLITFMNDDEARAIQTKRVDLQLHTHRHRFPTEDKAAARAEIVENRDYLKGLTSGELVHLCYPSGEYDVDQFSLLEELGIESATTTQNGFNTEKTHRFEMTRFLDSEYITPIEFEAEMSGFFELIRRVGYEI